MSKSLQDRIMKKVALCLMLINCLVLIGTIIFFVMGSEKRTTLLNYFEVMSNIYIYAFIVSGIYYMVARSILINVQFAVYKYKDKYSINRKFFSYTIGIFFSTIIQSLAYFILAVIPVFIIISGFDLDERYMFTLTVSFIILITIIDLTWFKFSQLLDKPFVYVLSKFNKIEFDEVLKEEKNIRKIYNFEKFFGIIATVTTVLVIGDAAGLVAFPLEKKSDESYLDAYLESKHYVFMALFVGSTVSFLKEQIIGGIKKKTD